MELDFNFQVQRLTRDFVHHLRFDRSKAFFKTVIAGQNHFGAAAKSRQRTYRQNMFQGQKLSESIFLAINFR